jgi:hypothetical protein
LRDAICRRLTQLHDIATLRESRRIDEAALRRRDIKRRAAGAVAVDLGL